MKLDGTLVYSLLLLGFLSAGTLVFLLSATITQATGGVL